MAIQAQRRLMQNNVLLLQTAAALAGAPELAADLDDTPNAAVVFAERLRALSVSERRSLLVQATSAAASIASLIWTVAHLSGSAAISLVSVLLSLMTLIAALRDSLGDE
jgi:hypothetical protein